MSATRAILGARVRTMDPRRPWATAVAWDGATIVAVGDDAEVRAACDARTERLDGRGLSVVPGLVDGHMHPVWAADFAQGADCMGVEDRDELARRLRAERERAGPRGIVRAWAVDYELLPGLDGRDLRALAGGPALVTCYDLHTYVATPEVLELAGIHGAEAFPDRSEVVVDADGRPTGELREFSAFDRVAAALPGIGGPSRAERVVALLAELNAMGLTGAHVMDGDPDKLDLVDALDAGGRLTLRLSVPLWVKPEHGDDVLDAYAAMAGRGGRLWRGGAAKFFVDGVVETGTAWLDEPGSEPFWPTEDDYRAAVRHMAAAGFRCATHAIGDRAVRAALDAYAGAARPAAGRHRIEHLETAQDAEVDRVAAEGVVASMQPLHMQWREPDGSDLWARRLGPERAARAFRTGDLHRRGATLVLGSDWPVAQSDPRLGMAWARLRRRPGRPDLPCFEPDQRLDGLTALAGYTTAPPVVTGDEAVAGRIRPGMRADLTAFAADPVETGADDLVDLPVLLTVVDGRVVWRALTR